MNVELTKLKGENKLTEIRFRKANDCNPEKIFSEEGVVDYYLRPDVVIAENGLGPPKLDLNALITQREFGSLNRIGLD